MGSHPWKPQPPLWSWDLRFIQRLFQGGLAEREDGGWQGSHIKGAKKGGSDLEKNFLVWDRVSFDFTQLKEMMFLLM